MNHVTQQKLNGWSVMQLQCTLRVRLTLDIGTDSCGQAKDGVFSPTANQRSERDSARELALGEFTRTFKHRSQIDNEWPVQVAMAQTFKN